MFPVAMTLGKIGGSILARVTMADCTVSKGTDSERTFSWWWKHNTQGKIGKGYASLAGSVWEPNTLATHALLKLKSQMGKGPYNRNR